MPHIVVAFDKFGGACSAAEACSAFAQGIEAQPAWEGRGIEVIRHPVSDGGEGLASVLEVRAEEVLRVPTTGPHGEPVLGLVLSVDGALIIESADACGIRHLPPPGRSPLDTTTAGLASLMEAAWRWRPGTPLKVGLGGSRTVDAGLGLLVGLGAIAECRSGRRLSGLARDLGSVHRVRLEAAEVWLERDLQAWADVRAPLLGEAHVTGASFLAQKGLSPAEGREIVAGWRALAEAMERGGHPVDPLAAGTGAAGGLGLALHALGAELWEGAEAFLELTGFSELLEGCMHVVTGEGRFDASSLAGKAPGAVLERAAHGGVPATLVAGTVSGAPSSCRALSLTAPDEDLRAASAATLTRLRSAAGELIW